MALPLRQKLTLISLLVYWPFIFILSHIPIPRLVRKAGVSDKTLHFLVYLILIFLLWFAVSPEKKVAYRRIALWVVFLIAVLYGIVDEFIQGLVGRNFDMMDFWADLAGVLTGLVLFAFLSFWPAFLVVIGGAIFLLANLSKVSPADLLPVTNAAFYLVGFAVFTLLWITNMCMFLSAKLSQGKWLITALVLPISFLIFVKVFSLFCGKELVILEIIISLISIISVVAVSFIVLFSRRVY